MLRYPARNTEHVRLLASAARTTLVLARTAGRLRIVGLTEIGSAKMTAAAAVGNVTFRAALDFGCIGLAHLIFPFITQVIASGTRPDDVESILREEVSLSATGY
jgi:hypothetical protein